MYEKNCEKNTLVRIAKKIIKLNLLMWYDSLMNFNDFKFFYISNKLILLTFKKNSSHLI